MDPYRSQRAAMLVRAAHHPVATWNVNVRDDLLAAAASFDPSASIESNGQVASAADLRAGADYLIAHDLHEEGDRLLGEAQRIQGERSQAGLARVEVTDVLRHEGSRVRSFRFDQIDESVVWIETDDNASRYIFPTPIDDLPADLCDAVIGVRATLDQAEKPTA